VKKNNSGSIFAKKPILRGKTGKVHELYSKIKQWLMPLESEGLLRYKEETLPISGISEESGINDRNDLTIKFFNGATIKLESVDLEVVGAYGRIDMQLGLRRIMIILKEEKSEWIFTERYGLEKNPTYDFNQETFEQIVTEFVESFS
jgi:hypothetical protein